MTGAHLEQEMAAACEAVRQADLDRLRDLGVSINTIADMGAIYFPFGVMEAEPIGNGLYQPGIGQPHLILPILENNELVDLCAFQGARPDTWHLRAGAAWCLGIDASLSEPQVHLCGRPLDWLRGGREGDLHPRLELGRDPIARRNVRDDVLGPSRGPAASGRAGSLIHKSEDPA